MLKMKFVKSSPFLLIAYVAASACSLPSVKKPSGGTGGAGMEMCSDDATGGMGGAGDTGMGGSAAGGATGTGGSVTTYPIDREVTPTACSGDGVANPRAIDK